MAATKVRYGQSTNGVGIASNGTSLVAIYTFGASLKMPDAAAGAGGIIDSIRVYNSDTVAHVVELHNVPNGDTADVDTLIERITLAPKEVYRFVGPERALSGATIQIKLGEAHTSTAVYAKADVSEIYT